MDDRIERLEERLRALEGALRLRGTGSAKTIESAAPEPSRGLSPALRLRFPLRRREP